MNFNLDKSISILERTPEVLKELLYKLDHDWTSVNEGELTWSAFDVMGHLIHGEKTDWMARIKIILNDDLTDKTFEPFDRFAQEKESLGKTIEQLIDEFSTLRRKNIEQLNMLNIKETDLKKTARHPSLGIVTLAQLLATWTAHDMSHLNQITRVFVKHYEKDVGPWKAYLSILKEM